MHVCVTTELTIMSYTLSQTNLSTKEGSVLMNLSKPSSGSSLNTSQSQLLDCPHSGPSSSLLQEQASLIVEQTDANTYTHDRYPQNPQNANEDPFISKDEQNMEVGTYKRGHRRVKSKKKCFGTRNPLLIKPVKAPVLCLNLRTKMHKKTPETEVAKEISRCLHEVSRYDFGLYGIYGVIPDSLLFLCAEPHGQALLNRILIKKKSKNTFIMRTTNTNSSFLIYWIYMSHVHVYLCIGLEKSFESSNLLFICCAFEAKFSLQRFAATLTLMVVHVHLYTLNV